MRFQKFCDQDIEVEISFHRLILFLVPFSTVIFWLFNSPIIISWNIIFINIGLGYLTVILGHIIGLHRYFIHKSFSVRPWVKPILLFFDSLCGFGGPLSWARLHALRDYWQSQPQAPKAMTYGNSIFDDFIITLFSTFKTKDNKHLDTLPKGLLDDPLLIFFEKYYMLIQLLECALVWTLFSFEIFVLTVAIRKSLGTVMHWLVVYLVHNCGYQNYENKNACEQGRNQLILGWLTFGEAFHNNHHQFPDSASSGLKPWELDLGYWNIRLFETLGLVSQIHIAEDHFLTNKHR